jgi:hypothetical protein
MRRRKTKSRRMNLDLSAELRNLEVSLRDRMAEASEGMAEIRMVAEISITLLECANVVQAETLLTSTTLSIRCRSQRRCGRYGNLERRLRSSSDRALLAWGR